MIPATKRREDKRVAQRRRYLADARKKIRPAMKAVCEIYRVTEGDILSPFSKHHVVVTARRILVWIGGEHLRIPPGILADVMKRDRAQTGKNLHAVRAEMLRDSSKSSLRRQVEVVLRRLG